MNYLQEKKCQLKNIKNFNQNNKRNNIMMKRVGKDK